jgi:pimeloyl-ACP methyl ester carboxylesterase
MAKSLREMGVRRWFDEHGHLILGPKAQANAAAELTRIAVASGRTVSIVTEVLWETFGKADARPTVSRLANPRPPALVAVGSHDPTCPLAMAKDLAAALHAPAPLVLQGVGHLPMLEDPRRVASIVSALCLRADEAGQR